MRCSLAWPLLLIGMIAISGCQPVNIYWEIPQHQVEDAHSVLQRIHRGHGSPAEWRAQMSATAYFSDTWPVWLFRTADCPWKEETTDIKLDWQTARDNVRATILSGKKKNRIYGVQHWTTYEVRHEVVKFKRNGSMRFYLPTFEYFLELPFRLHEATAMAYGGQKDIDGTKYHCLFLSWNTLSPQKDIDQYIAYVHPLTNRIDYLDFTVREKNRRLLATVQYSEYKKVDQFVLPHRAIIHFMSQAPGQKVLHDIVVDSFVVRSGLPSEYFIPDPSRAAEK